MRSNHYLNMLIENEIDAYDGTVYGQELKNMYENGTSYESICDKMTLDYSEYKES